jgi:hypothetical protein
MDPWNPREKALHDIIDDIKDMVRLLAVAAALFVVVLITI